MLTALPSSGPAIQVEVTTPEVRGEGSKRYVEYTVKARGNQHNPPIPDCMGVQDCDGLRGIARDCFGLSDCRNRRKMISVSS